MVGVAVSAIVGVGAASVRIGVGAAGVAVGAGKSDMQPDKNNAMTAI